jgi:hypothetical protein
MKRWHDIYYWIDDSIINIFHLNVILKYKPYHAQIWHHTSRIHGHIVASQACRRCNNDPNWECHVSLDLA